MPLPSGLVEKKGSVARASDLGRHALAGVGDGDARHSRRPSRSRPVGSSTRPVEMVSVPPSGIASRALMARLRIAFSSWFSSQSARSASAPSSGPDRDRAADRVAEHQLHRLDHPVDRDRRHADPLDARESEQLAGQLGAAPARFERRLGDPLQPRLLDARGDISSPPMTGVSRLLKSWAMPPVSWPTASIFCAWRSASSARSRSPTSACSRSSAALRSAVRSATRALAASRYLGAQLPFGDVVGDADEADMLAARAPARLRDRAQPAPFAVAAAEARLQHERLQRRLAGDRFGEDARARRRDG